MEQPLRILPVGLKISLLTVVPGKERFVADKMQRAINEHPETNPVVTLKLFGRYDLCLIYKTNDFLSGPSRAGAVEGIRGGNQVFAFPWRSDSQDLFLRPDPKLRVWGLLFFRINESLAKQYGAIIEEVVAEKWRKTLQPGETVLDVLSTTGWGELIFIVRGKKFQGVTEALLRISQQIVLISSGKSPKQDLFAAKTFSMLGVDFKYLKVKNFSSISKFFKETYTPGKGVYPEVGVTCSPRDMHKVYKYGQENLGEGTTTFGGRDFCFVPSKCKTWGQLIATVLEMRKALSSSLYATAIDVRCPTSLEELPSLPSTKRTHRGIKVNRLLLEVFKRWGPDFENRLLNLYFGTSNLIQDPLIGDCFEDLRIMTASRFPELLRSLQPEDSDSRRIVLEIVESLEYGAEERANGAFLAIEHVENRFSPTQGGIQRVLRAAKLLPDQILRRIGLHYYGFVIAGFLNKGFSSHGEIINLPFEFVFHPEEWWGLFHEIGHAAFWDTKFIDLFKHKSIISRLDDLVADKSAKSRIDYWKNIFLEIGADSFDLFFCHDSKLDAYLKNIWPYVTRSKGIQEGHFARYFSMFQYWKYLLKNKRTRFPDKIDIPADLKDFRNQLSKLGFSAPEDQFYNDEAFYIFESIKPVMEVCHATYLRRKPITFKKTKSFIKTQKIVDTVLSGKVYSKGIIERPDEFILALQNQKRKLGNLSLDSRIAAILSLWHTATVFDNHNIT